MVWAPSLLTEIGGQGDRLGTAIHLLVGWGAVARRIVGGAVKDLTAITRAQRVGARSEGVAPFGAQLIWAYG